MDTHRPKARWKAMVVLFIALAAACTRTEEQRNDTQGSVGVASTSRRMVVAITQIATHPALDQVRNGLIAGLASRGYEDGKQIEILFRNANGDGSLTTAIAEDFVRRDPSVIVPISTPSALAVAKATAVIPVVFSGVTDPVGVQIVPELEHPGGNITGVSDRWPFEAQVLAFQRIFPKVKSIGMLYTKGDDVSKIGVEEMKRLSTALGFKLELRAVSAPQDVYPTTTALLGDVGAIYTGIDHLVLENMDGLVKAAREARKPIFGGESGSVENGAVLALSINMTEFGDLTADIVSKVLSGTPPGDIPVHVVREGELLVNVDSAARFGLDLSALESSGARLIRPK